MSKPFNPYHTWLGIPAEEQPPNHYRLLGIPLFESNEDVIQNGLDQRMAHVKSFATGPRAAESQSLLTALSQAGVCLLRPEKKLVYDQQLRSKLLASAATAEMRPSLPPPPCPPHAAAVSLGSPVAPGPTVSPGITDAPVVTVDIPDAARTRRSSHAGFPTVPTVVGAAIGLSLAFLALFLLPLGKKSPEMVAQIDSVEQMSEGGAETSEEVSGGEAPEPVSAPAGRQTGGTTPTLPFQPAPGPQPERTGPPTTGSQPETSSAGTLPTSPESQPPNPFETAGSQPLPSWPTPMPGSLPATPAFPPSLPGDPFSTGSNRSTLQDFLPGSPTPGTTPSATFSGTPKSIVLDLERSSMYVTLAENVEGQEVRAQVRSITNLTTAYDLQPNDGIVSFGQPVDVLLTQHAGVRIRLSLRMRGKNVDLEIAPEIETGQGKTSDFSKRTLDLLSRSTKKDALALNKQLAAAQSEAMEIQNWLASPVVKTIPVRNARTQRLSFLMSQMIPSLQKQLADAQVRSDLIQQLSLLVAQVHEKASLDLVVQAEQENGVK